MKKDFKKIVLLGLAAGFVCLSAQDAEIAIEETSAAKEVSMAQPGARCCDDDRGLNLLPEQEARGDDFDYDVYTVGDGDRCEKPARDNPCREKPCRDSSKDKSGCDTKCKRKGAAKVAQE